MIQIYVGFVPIRSCLNKDVRLSGVSSVPDVLNFYMPVHLLLSSRWQFLFLVSLNLFCDHRQAVTYLDPDRSDSDDHNGLHDPPVPSVIPVFVILLDPSRESDRASSSKP